MRGAFGEESKNVLEDFEGEGGEADAVGGEVGSGEESDESSTKVDARVCEGVRLGGGSAELAWT